MYTVFLILSLISLALCVLIALRINRTYKRTRLLTPSRVLAVGVFVSTWLLLFPYYYQSVFSRQFILTRIWESIWVAVHHAIRFFVVDADYFDFYTISERSGIGLYFILGTVLMILAPLMTFSVILSFFSNFTAYRKYIMHPGAPTYVFSELSEKSLALATDIKRNHPRAVIVFTDVFEEDNEESFEIRERAKEIGALCFKKDMLSINLYFHSRRSLLCFFAIAEDKSVRGMYRQMQSSTTAEEENLKQAYKLATHRYYSRRPNTYLYVFTSGTQGEIVLDNLPKSNLTVRRVERFRPLILQTLYQDGKELLFDRAVDGENGEKQINVVVVGAGGYGREMIKTLAWYCQMDGYRLTVDVFDIDPLASEEFAFECPGLMDPTHNGTFRDGEAGFHIRFHDGISVKTDRFDEQLGEIQWPTYVFVALGSDELNVNTAVTVRRVYRQKGCPYDPFIHTVVYDSEIKKVLTGATDRRGIQYDIHYIGDLRETYSERVVVSQELGGEALNSYQQWVDGDFQSGYDYRSSVAVVMHRMLCEKMGLSAENDAYEEEHAERLQLLEHRRWMAYTYAEGYVYGLKRDDIAKTHPALLPYGQLPAPFRRGR